MPLHVLGDFADSEVDRLEDLPVTLDGVRFDRHVEGGRDGGLELGGGLVPVLGGHGEQVRRLGFG